MTSTVKRSDALRRIEMEEDYSHELNLTGDQRDWNQLNGIISRHVFRQRKLIEHMVIAFKASSLSRRKLGHFDVSKPIVHKDQVAVVFLNPIDARHWNQGNPDRRYRLNYLETRLRRMTPGTGSVELWATGENEPSDNWRKLVQKDLLKRPLQDHPCFMLHEYDPSGLLAGVQMDGKSIVDPVLKAPFAGRFELVRNDCHCDVMLNGNPVFRLLSEDAKTILTHAQDESLAEIGGRVKRGAPLIKFQQKTGYGVLRFRDRKPEMDRIYGDVFCASKRHHGENLKSLRLAIAMLRRIIWAMTDDDQLPSPVPISEWAPRHLLEFESTSVWTFPVRERWSVTPELRADLVEAVSPKGDFYIRCSAETPTEIVEASNDGHTLRYGDGTVQTLPNQAQLLNSVVQGSKVSPEAPIADWLPRDYHSWPTLAALPYLGLLIQHYLQESAVRPGVDGYEGCGVLLPASYIPEDLQNTISSEDYLDFRPMSGYCENGTYVGPPLKQTDWTDFNREANGILYSGNPRGDHLLVHPIVDGYRR